MLIIKVFAIPVISIICEDFKPPIVPKSKLISNEPSEDFRIVRYALFMDDK